MKNHLFLLCMVLFGCSTPKEIAQTEKVTSHPFSADELKIRIAKLEIDSLYFDEYIAILQEEAAKSVELEEGVLCIYPMYQRDNPTQIRLLEIYQNEAAYQAHLKTPHFLYYKEATRKMVKFLELIDMEAIDEASMPTIFRKIH